MKRADLVRRTATGVADSLFETEAAVDHAIMQIAALAHHLPAASRSAGFSATRGQTIHETVAEALVAQSKVRAAIVAVHHQLAALKDDSIMRSVAIGGGSKDTPPGQSPPKVAFLPSAG